MEMLLERLSDEENGLKSEGPKWSVIEISIKLVKKATKERNRTISTITEMLKIPEVKHVQVAHSISQVVFSST